MICNPHDVLINLRSHLHLSFRCKCIEPGDEALNELYLTSEESLIAASAVKVPAKQRSQMPVWADVDAPMEPLQYNTELVSAYPKVALRLLGLKRPPS